MVSSGLLRSPQEKEKDFSRINLVFVDKTQNKFHFIYWQMKTTVLLNKSRCYLNEARTLFIQGLKDTNRTRSGVKVTPQEKKQTKCILSNERQTPLLLKPSL